MSANQRKHIDSSFPRVAFCFYDPKPVAPSLWLRDFMLQPKLPVHRIVAILPGPSDLEEKLWNARVPIRLIYDLSRLSTSKNLSVLLPLVMNRFNVVSQYRRLFRRERIQLVYINSSKHVAPMIAARKENIPILSHIHGAPSSRQMRRKRRQAVRRHPQAVLFSTQAAQRFFEPAPAGKRWEIVPKGVSRSLSELRRRRDDIRASLDYTEDEILFLFPGRITQSKGAPELLEAWPEVREKNPQAKLVFAGSIPKAEKHPTLRSLESKPPEGVQLLGPRKDIHELIAAADFLVFPSYAEALPLHISEAMMTGTPVIARAVGEIPWQIGEGRGFLYRGRGVEALRRQLFEALENPERAAEQADAAQDFARIHLDRDKQYKKVRRLIVETARKDPRSRS